MCANQYYEKIDYRKNKSNDRVGNRARAASATFRRMLPDGRKVVHANSPRVILSIEPSHKYSARLAGQLNYAERDDQLVGTLYEFAQQNEASDVRLLTHDTTPLYVAQAHKLKVDLIPHEWLLPPVATETETKLRSLQTEYARLKKAEPSFSIGFLDHTDNDVETYRASYTWFQPLGDADVEELVRRLRDRFPAETTFGSSEPAKRRRPPGISNLLLGAEEEYVPATDEAIAKYRDVDYPQWLESCEVRLRNHHLFLQRGLPPLEFSFIADNRGTRPATDALITIGAQGDLLIMPPSKDESEYGVEAGDSDSNKEGNETLPEPPVAPRGRWGQGRHVDMRALIRSASDITRNLGGIDNRDYLAGLVRQPNQHDANSFYYKPGRPSIPQATFSLECEQWRHDDGEEHFVGEIHVPRQHDHVEGAIVCRIQAGNLSASESKTIPVRIAIVRVSAKESAEQMVESLLQKGINTG